MMKKMATKKLSKNKLFIPSKYLTLDGVREYNRILKENEYLFQLDVSLLNNFNQWLVDEWEIDELFMDSSEVEDVWSDLLENDNYIDTSSFDNCCGVSEGSLHSLNDMNGNKLLQIAIWLVLDEKAGIIFTDNNCKNKIHKLLSAVVPPIPLGKNPGSGNNLWMWVITQDNLKAYAKKQQATKK